MLLALVAGRGGQATKRSWPFSDSGRHRALPGVHGAGTATAALQGRDRFCVRPPRPRDAPITGVL